MVEFQTRARHNQKLDVRMTQFVNFRLFNVLQVFRAGILETLPRISEYFPNWSSPAETSLQTFISWI